eukprot:6203383-Pleurochrysis_carterae.AAC.2
MYSISTTGLATISKQRASEIAVTGTELAKFPRCRSSQRGASNGQSANPAKSLRCLLRGAWHVCSLCRLKRLWIDNHGFCVIGFKTCMLFWGAAKDSGRILTVGGTGLRKLPESPGCKVKNTMRGARKIFIGYPCHSASPGGFTLLCPSRWIALKADALHLQLQLSVQRCLMEEYYAHTDCTCRCKVAASVARVGAVERACVRTGSSHRLLMTVNWRLKTRKGSASILILPSANNFISIREIPLAKSYFMNGEPGVKFGKMQEYIPFVVAGKKAPPQMQRDVATQLNLLAQVASLRLQLTQC